MRTPKHLIFTALAVLALGCSTGGGGRRTSDAGSTGTDQTDGADQTDATTGFDGTTSSDETDATDGAEGTDGTSGFDGTDGTPGFDGTDTGEGTDSAEGTDGTDGPTDGTDGAEGTDGGTDSTDAGTDGTDGGEKLDCNGLAGCINDCQSEGCAQQCAENATIEAQQTYQTALSCIQNACPGGEQSCLQQAQTGECAEEVQACVGTQGPVGCVNDGICNPEDDDCVCPDCDADEYCSNPANCSNNGTCDPYNEGCVCGDCATHPECTDNPAPPGE